MIQQQDNIANYYVLPILDLNKTSFGEGNIINTFITKEREIAVLVKDSHQVPDRIYSHENYQFDFQDPTSDGNTAIIFSVPEFFLEDLTKFMQGRYSKFTPNLKSLVLKHGVLAGLKYNVPIAQKGSDGRPLVIIDRRIRALDNQDVELRRRLEESIGQMLPADAELLDVPNEANYYSYKE